MIAIDKLMKIIIVVLVVVLVFGGLYKADINRFLRNAIPDYSTPEHEEIPVEKIDGVCGEGWVKVARSVSNKIGFCGDEECGEESLIESSLYINKIGEEWEIYPSPKEYFRVDLIMGKIDSDGIFSIEKNIFLGKGDVYDKYKEDFEKISYNNLVNLDGAELKGAFICRKGEKLTMMDYDKKDVDWADWNKCEVDNDKKVVSEESCACLIKQERGYPGAYNYGELSIGKCSKDKYCYSEDEGCLKGKIIDLESSRIFTKEKTSFYFFKSLDVFLDLNPYVVSVGTGKFILTEKDGVILVKKGDTEIAIINSDGFLWFNSFSEIKDRNRQYTIATIGGDVKFNEILSIESEDFVLSSATNGPIKLKFLYKSNLRIDYNEMLGNLQ